MAGGALSLAGWVFDVPRLADWKGVGISTQPNTGVAIAFAGAALLALVNGRSRLGVGFAAVPALLGGLTLLQYLSGLSFGIDLLLTFGRDWGFGRASYPGRMGLPAAMTLLSLGIALIARTRGEMAQHVSNTLGLLALPIAAMSLMAYTFGADPLYDVPIVTAIAWQTSLLLTVLCIGVLASNWRLSPVSVLIEDGGPGEIARRALPFIVGVPVGLGWIRIEAQRAGLFGLASGTTLLVLVLMAMMIVGMLWIVAAIRRREAALAALAAQLQAADRRKDEFLATLAHELRNPLAPIASGLELLKRDASLAATPQSLVAMMQRQMALMRRMVDDLLDISRITRGHFELRRETLDLRDVVTRAVETARDLAAQHRHELRVDLPPAPINVFGDADRLAQVVANLVNNACKYTPDGGKVRVTAQRDGGEARIVVSDNGVGIPAHLRERVFEMFAQVDSSLERSHGGLGIGLTLVRRIVEKHGGVVSAGAPPDGAGSEFVVALPLSRLAEA